MSVRIKICGITNAKDAELAVKFGADAVGLNFFPKSPRYISLIEAQAVVRDLPPFVDPVALFVNEPWPTISERLQALPQIRTVQWHGDQPEPCPYGSYRFVPAFPICDEESLVYIEQWMGSCRDAGCSVNAVVVDGHVKGKYGGTGKCAPWELLADFKPGVPLILAGGLTPENVAEAVRVVKPYAVDVAGGVEREPGRKDADLMKRFVDTVRSIG